VVELLRSRGVEPVVRRSAVTQISVMLEDSNLHDQFLKQDGLNTILDILQNALVSCLLFLKTVRGNEGAEAVFSLNPENGERKRRSGGSFLVKS
jgi:hypothetical protein